MDVGMTLGAGYGESRVLNGPKLINDLRLLLSVHYYYASLYRVTISPLSTSYYIKYN